MALLDGKLGLIFGVANDRSYATFIAQSLITHGAKCAFAHLPGEKNERRTRKAVEGLGVSDPWLFPCDAGKDEDLDAIFDAYSKAFGGKMNYLIHSIAFADRGRQAFTAEFGYGTVFSWTRTATTAVAAPPGSAAASAARYG